jgi:hypothetical protein
VTREALILATGRYDDPRLRALRSPAQDAKALAEVLADPAIGDFVVEQVIDGDERTVRRTLHRFFKDRTRKDVLLVHVSCHGIKDDDGNLFFATSETTMDDLAVTAVPSTFLREQMEECRAQAIVLMLDCCYAGAFAPGAKGDEGVHLKERLEGKGRVILTASNSIEYSWEGEELSGEGTPSVFTAAVLEGLRSGDADLDGDGVIRPGELYSYIWDRMLEAERKQTPQKFEQLEGDLQIAWNPRGAPVLPADLLDALGSPYVGVRAGAARDLAAFLTAKGQRSRQEARERLEQLLGDDSQMVRMAAAEALGVGPALEPDDGTGDDGATTTLDRDSDGRGSSDDGGAGGTPRPRPTRHRVAAAAVTTLVVVAVAALVPLLRSGGGTEDEEAEATPAEEIPAEEPEPVAVWVSALESWTDTGIDLVPGARLTITASGEVCDDITRPERCFPPDGVDEPPEQHPGDPPPAEANHAALIGTIDDAGPFLVGSYADLEVQDAGRLFLGMKDGHFDDNSGGFDVEITVVGP